MQPVIYADPTSEAHDGGPDHPERPERLTACLDAVARAGLTPVTDLPAATDEQLARVHAVGYLERLERFCRRGGGLIDQDTYAGEESFEIARRASGAACRAAGDAFASGQTAVCLVRPPGHHATRTRAMGFCLLNHVAVGAAHAATLAPQGRVAAKPAAYPPQAVWLREGHRRDRRARRPPGESPCDRSAPDARSWWTVPQPAAARSSSTCGSVPWSSVETRA